MSAGVRVDTTDFAALAPSFSAAWLAQAPQELHRRRTGALVSADLSGFTAMSERLASLGKEGAERLTEIVNGCFDTLISIAASEGGDVLKFGGDALLIWFEGEDGAERSARASVRMQRAIGKPRFVKLGLKMSVGAHFDDFDLFLVGEPDWRELVLVGAPVTRTVELESAAEAGQVLVSREMAALLPSGWSGKKVAGGVLLDPAAVPQQRRASRELVPAPGEAGLVAPRLRDEVAALASLGGEHRIASIVFLEVLGTDESLHRAGPEEFARGLDALVRAAQGADNGRSVQFLYTDVIADGVKLIATAGAPVSTMNDDESALRYAVDIVHGDPLQR
ncbi:MAG: adenylate/guanylate cyclase domain-containing protein, partial [Marmoricola sp.]